MHDYHTLSPEHLPFAKNACSMHDTLCHARSIAHEYPILTPSVTAEDPQDHNDMRKRVSARSTGLPLSALRSVNSSNQHIKNRWPS